MTVDSSRTVGSDLDIKSLKDHDDKINNHVESGCPIKSSRKPYKLRNLLDGSILYDTLHFEANENDCTASRCTGSVYLPPVHDQRPHGVPRPRAVTKKYAIDFMKEYYQSLQKQNSEQHRQREIEVIKEIEKKGDYDHTTDELQFGCTLAWRNAPRCIGRMQYKKLKVFDFRHITTTQEFFECLLEHIDYGTNKGNIRSAISIFPQRRENMKEFRIWNSQLLRYAGYKQADGSVIGDPGNLFLTEVAQKLGWVGPNTPFDILPLILQINGEPPEIFEIPPEYVLEVNMEHPKYPDIAKLNLKWYAVPAISNMMLDLGGIEFTAAPFNGWYMGAELGSRNFTDTSRYNMCKPIAKAIELDTSSQASLWLDKVMIEMTTAVLYSFNKNGVTMADHHSSSQTFMKHLKNETKVRGGCPSDWVWIVPPISASSTPVFHQEMLNYRLKPNFEYQIDPWNFYKIFEPNKWTVKILAYASWFTSALMKNVMKKRHKVTILYATETGKSETYAVLLNKIFLSNFNSKVLCMDEYNFSDINKEKCLLIVTSTFGNGEAPDNGKEFGKKLHKMSRSSTLKLGSEQLFVNENLRYAVFALGSKAYPHFCNFGNSLNKSLKSLGANEITPIGEGDELNEQDETFNTWSIKCFQETCNLLDVKINENMLAKFENQKHLKKVSPKYRIVLSKQSVDEDCVTGLSKLHKKKIFANRMVSVTNLQDANSSRVTSLVRVKKDNFKEMNYLPGDHFCVYPSNNVHMVSELLDFVKCNNILRDAPISVVIDNEAEVTDSELSSTIRSIPFPASLEQIFTSYLDITLPPSTKLLKVLADHCTSPDERDSLYNLVNNHTNYEEWRNEYFPTILETLNLFPSIDIDVITLIASSVILKPRYYSISSSQAVSPDEIDLTVALVQYQINEGITHKGVCTSYLHELSYGEIIPSSIRKTEDFRLPTDNDVPIIMVGPGSGIAPFRAFWQQRAHEKKTSPVSQTFGTSILFFGCRDSQLDDIYANETKKAVKDGVITKVYTGYSRDKNHPKKYVQHLIEDNKKEVVDLLIGKKGHLYVCGDVAMAADVSDTIIKIIKSQMTCTYADAEVIFENLKENGRYSEDIFGVTFKAGKSISN